MKVLLWGPVLTASGYGEHARQILSGLLARPDIDLSVKSVRWGQTPFLDDEDGLVKKARELAAKGEAEEKAGARYDVAIQVTIPNEFKRMAPFHVGVTAGIETDRVSPIWIQKANQEVDLVVVPSQHSAATFANITYQDQGGKQLRLEKPVLVAPEGVDVLAFNGSPREDTGLLADMPDFCFLSVGLGLDKPLGEDRKNISGLIKAFCEEFKDDDRVGLALKVSLMNGSLMDFETVKDRVAQIKRLTGCGELPKIKLIHGRMSKKELGRLYRDPKVGAYVTLTHGEGFGLPVLEAAACGVPVIATDWSGHTDFLRTPDGKRRFVPVEFDLKEIPGSAVWDGVMDRGTRWAEPRVADARAKMKKVFLSPGKPREWAQELCSNVISSHAVGALAEKVVAKVLEFAGQGSSGTQRPQSQAEVKATARQQLEVPEGKKTLLFTMPMSAGDVVASTGTVSALRKKFPDHFIVYATSPQFSNLLKGNPDVDKVAVFEQWMTDVPFCEGIFDEVYTPNLAIQLTTSNWVHGGKGRKLADEMAAQCGVEFDTYRINVEDVSGLGLPKSFVAFHPGSGQGQHEARNYKRWRQVVHNLRRLGLTVVTVGQEGDIHFEGCMDLRGRTNYGQLAGVIQRASCLVGIDSVTMHMAAALGVPHVAIFGSSYASSTGPVYESEDDNLGILLETQNRLGCEKACYKHQCKVNRDRSCLNEIDPKEIVFSVLYLLRTSCGLDISGASVRKEVEEGWTDARPKIAGYTHLLNAEEQGFPYLQSIRSMLGFCDEVVVVDGGSTDGTVEKVRAIGDPRVKVYERKWDWNEPGMDGMQKAFARAMCSVGPDDFLWQQDADEVVSERDYEKVKRLAEDFPAGCDLVHLPVVELWAGQEKFRTDRHSWKWRMSRNNFRITHGINKDARVFDQQTGKTFAKKGMSDGCEYVDVLTGEYINHRGFYDQRLEVLRRSAPSEYGKEMNRIFGELPSVFHYSWADIPRKIRNFKTFWNRCWSNLYNETQPEDRFPDVDLTVPGSLEAKAAQVAERGGEHGPGVTVTLGVPAPQSMVGWSGDNRPDRHDDAPAAAPAAVAPVPVGVRGQEPLPADGSP